MRRILEKHQPDLPNLPRSQHLARGALQRNQDLAIKVEQNPTLVSGGDSPEYKVPQIVNIDFRELKELTPQRSRDSDEFNRNKTMLR
jgi:hypothetical protein